MTHPVELACLLSIFASCGTLELHSSNLCVLFIVIDITSVGHSSVLGKSLTSSALTFPLDDGLMSMVFLFQKNVKVLSDDANDANLVLPFEGEYYGGPL